LPTPRPPAPRAGAQPARSVRGSEPGGVGTVPGRAGHRRRGALSDRRALLRQDDRRRPGDRDGARLQRLAARYLPPARPAPQGRGAAAAPGPRRRGDRATACRHRAGHGRRPPASTGLKSHLGDKLYWPVYAEADRLGCGLAVHGGAHSGLGFDHLNVFAAIHALGHPFGIAIVFASLVINGIFDKFPNVRFGFLEGGVGWFLLALERLEGSYKAFTPYDPRGEFLRLEPGESVADYIIRHVKAGRIYVGVEGEEPALAYAVKAVGPEAFVFSSDFPHEVNIDTCRHEVEEVLENDALS